jgi:Ecdysteroid kinase-like family
MTAHATELGSSPHQSGQLDVEWLTQRLRAAGVLREAAVVAVRGKPIGNGLLGQSVRFELQLDREEDSAPKALVGKFAATGPSSRALCVANELYLREVRFYQEVAPSVSMCTPRIYVAEIDLATHDYILLMEDLSPARQGDQLAGCSIQDCMVALGEIAKLHAVYWRRPDLSDRPWLRGVPERYRRQAAALPNAVQQYMQRFGSRLEPEVRRLLEGFASRYSLVVGDRTSPWTLQHGDFRLDNVMFDVRDRAGTMATLDWQTINAGCGLFDVAFFVGCALPTDQRRRVECDLVRGYHDGLCRLGVCDYSFEECWRDYRRYSVRSLYTPIAAGLSVEPSERGDQLLASMMRGLARMVLDHDALTLWA